MINHGKSQQFTAGLMTGIGKYSMEDLKNINSEVGYNHHFDTRLVSNFPVYIYFQPVLMMQIERTNIGVIYSFHSTGSRISAKDYSGEYRFDMIVNSNNPGIYLDYQLDSTSKIDFKLYGIGGISLSKLKMNEYLVVQDKVLANDDQSFISTNYDIQAGLNFNYKILEYLSVGIYCGYLVQVSRKGFYVSGNKDAQLAIRPKWNGFRTGFKVSFMPHQFKKVQRARENPGI